MRVLLGLSPGLLCIAWLWFADDVSVVKGAVLGLIAVPCAIYLALQDRFDRKDLLVVAFVAWCAWSLAWSPDWRQGVVDLQLYGTAAVLLLVLRRVGPLPPWSIGAAVLIALNPFLPFGGAFNENTQAEFLLVAIPLLLTAKHGPWLAALAILATAFVLLWSPSNMGWGLLAGAAFLWLLWMAYREKYRPAAFAVIVLGLCAVVLGLIHWPELRFLALPRLQLYAAAIKMWGENPFFGNGLGSFNHLWPEFANADVDIFTGMTFLHANDPTVLPGTVHNEYLSILQGTGIVGFSLFLAAVVTGIRRNRPALASLTALGLLMAVDAPLHDPQTLFLGAYALGIASPMAANAWKMPAFSLLGTAPVVLVAIFSAWMSVNHARAEVMFGLARNLNAERPQFAFAAILEAHRTYPWDYKYRVQLFPTLTRALLTGQIRTTWQEVDLVYKTSVEAVPNAPHLLLARLTLLKAGGKCMDPRLVGPDECDSVARWVRALNPRMLAAQNA